MTHPGGWHRRVRQVYRLVDDGAAAPATPTLTITTAPAGGTDNAAFVTQPVITYSVAQAGVVVTASLASGTGELIGVLTATTNSAGVATFATLGVNVTSPPSSVTITFSASGATGATTGSLSIAAQVGGSGTWPNEPIGGGWSRVVDWTPTVAPGVTSPSSEGLRDFGPYNDPSRPWYGGGGTLTSLGDIVTDGTSPVSPQVYRVKFPAGFWGGVGPQQPVYVFGTPLSWDRALSTGHMYIGCYFKFSSGFTCNGNVGQKILYLYADTPNLAPATPWQVANPAIPVNIQIPNTGAGPGSKPIYVNQYRDYGPDGVLDDGPTSDDEPHFFNAPTDWSSQPANVFDAAWHRFEALVTPNTWTGSVANANGVVSTYLDGSLLKTDTGMTIFGNRTTVPHFNYFGISPFYGGGSAVVPADQYMYIAGIRAATK
jgi:hypothetical protein